MLVTLDSIGMRLTYDREGKYPIDTTNPIDLPSFQKSFTVYMSLKPPTQLEDGSWEWYYNNSGFTNKLYWSSGSHSYLVGGPFGVKIGHSMIDSKKNINMSDIVIEEMFWAEDHLNSDIFISWYKDKVPLISNDNGVMDVDTAKKNKTIFYFKPDGVSPLRYEDSFNEEFFFKETPKYVSGVNYEAVNLVDNELTFKKTITNNLFSFAMRIMIPSDTWNNNSTIEIYNDNNISIVVDIYNKQIILRTIGLLNTNTEKSIPLKHNNNEFFTIWVTYKNGTISLGVADEFVTFFSSSILQPKSILYRDKDSNAEVSIKDYYRGRNGWKQTKEVSSNDDKILKKIYYNDYDNHSFKYDMRARYFKIEREYHKYGLSNLYGRGGTISYIYSLKRPTIGNGSRIDLINIDGPFYLWPWLNIAYYQNIYRKIQRIHPISGKLETVSSELFIV